MRTSYKVILLILSHMLVGFAAINLSFMPPTSVPFREIALSMNPIARSFYIEQLSSSAHRALIVKSAIEIGIFEVFRDDDENDAVALSECVSLEEIYSTLKIMEKAHPSRPALKDMLEALSTMSLIESCEIFPNGNNKNNNLFSFQKQEQIQQQQEDFHKNNFGYSLSITSKIHLNGRGRGSVRRGILMMGNDHQDVEKSPTTVLDTDDWSGMILTANSNSVIESLIHLTERIREERKHKEENRNNRKDNIEVVASSRSLSISRSEEGELWKGFAANTHEIFTETARLCVRELLTKYFSKKPAETENFLFFDVGAGSAVVAEEFCRQMKSGEIEQLSSSWKYVLVDLPDVTEYLSSQDIQNTFCKVASSIEQQDDSKNKNDSPVSLVATNATSGEQFSTDIHNAIIAQTSQNPSSTTTILFSLNAFLQHFDDEVCWDILRRLFKAAKTDKNIDNIIFSIMELENPQGSFNYLTEWLPVGRIFSLVLRAFTNSGFVRTENSYAKMLEVVSSEKDKDEKQWKCDEFGSRKPMFPLPGSLSSIQCVRM